MEQRHRARRRLRPHPRRLGFLAGSGTTPSPTPTIPPITVIDDDGNTVTIVARGENYSESNYITVIDTNGKRYLIRYYNNESGLKADGTYDDEGFDRSTLDGVITTVNVDGVTPANNWLLLAWLNIYYGIVLSVNDLYNKSGVSANDCSIACENGLQTIGGTVGGRAVKGVIYDDAICGPDANKYINCSGKQVTAEPEMGTFIETQDLEVLTLEDATSTDKKKALTTLILQVDGYIDYPIKVMPPRYNADDLVGLTLSKLYPLQMFELTGNGETKSYLFNTSCLEITNDNNAFYVSVLTVNEEVVEYDYEVNQETQQAQITSVSSESSGDDYDTIVEYIKEFAPLLDISFEKKQSISVLPQQWCEY